MVSSSFRPETNGFRFANGFVNVPVLVAGGVKVTTSGRGGGMCFAALDYHLAGRPSPDRVDLPRDEDPLGSYLLRRHHDSYQSNTAVRFLWWTLMADTEEPDLPGVAELTRTQELPKLRSRLDDGEPVVLGLIGGRRWTHAGRRNHQVIAYRYEQHPNGSTSIAVYDPNSPNVTTSLSVEPDRVDLPADNRDRAWRGFFVHSYQPADPPSRPPRA